MYTDKTYQDFDFLNKRCTNIGFLIDTKSYSLLFVFLYVANLFKKIIYLAF